MQEEINLMNKYFLDRTIMHDKEILSKFFDDLILALLNKEDLYDNY